MNESDFNLAGLIDLHIHSAPDVQPRYADDIEIARQARQAGMRAILIKSHVTLTADRAAIAEKVVEGVRVFGGLVLNAPVGGLNPAAVEAALSLGAREIWMPTRSAAHARQQEGQPGGITLLDENGELPPEVYEIIDLVKQGDAILGSGHISPRETSLLARLARRRGLRRFLITHPEAAFIRMPLEMQVALAGEGAFFERCYVDTTPLLHSTVSVEEIYHRIREVGVSSTVLSTDFGQAGNPPPVQGLRLYLAQLQALGFTLQELRQMAGDQPAYLLGL
jgi:hypothetical protein